MEQRLSGTCCQRFFSQLQFIRSMVSSTQKKRIFFGNPPSPGLGRVSKKRTRAASLIRLNRTPSARFPGARVLSGEGWRAVLTRLREAVGGQWRAARNTDNCSSGASHGKGLPSPELWKNICRVKSATILLCGVPKQGTLPHQQGGESRGQPGKIPREESGESQREETGISLKKQKARTVPTFRLLNFGGNHGKGKLP